MFRSKKFLVVFLGLYIMAIGRTQTTCLFKHFSVEDGLSHSGVLCMLQDCDGFMWFGTLDGLNRFDGYSFKVYKSRPGDSCQLSHNRIDEIYQDRLGYIWVKTYDERLHRFDRKTETFKPIPQGVREFSEINDRVTKFYETSSGEMWLATANTGCYRAKSDTISRGVYVTRYSTDQTNDRKIKGKNVSFIFEDSQKNIWIATEAGLNCVESKQKARINLAISRLGAFEARTFKVLGNKVYFGSDRGVVAVFDLKNLKFEAIPSQQSSSITSMEALGQDRLLVGFQNGKISVIDVRSNKFDAAAFANLSSPIRSIYVDQMGLAWIETEQNGVTKFDIKTKSIKRFTQNTDKVSPYVFLGNTFRIYEDVNQTLWLTLKGGGFGFYNRQTDQIEYFYNLPGSAQKRFSNLVTTVTSDRQGNLWMSTYSRGVEKVSFISRHFRFNKPSKDENEFATNDVRTIFKDKQKNMWIGTREGKLYVYDSRMQLRKVFSRDTKGGGSISFNGMVYSIIQDRSGAIWLGTKGDGVVRVEYEGDPARMIFKTEHYSYDARNNYSLSNDLVYSIFQDSKDRIWIGTFGGGLNLVSGTPGHYRFLNSSNELKTYPIVDYSKVRHIQEDSHQQIWLATTSGLVIFNPNVSATLGIVFNKFQKNAGDAFSLSGNDAHYIFRDKSNCMWVGTFGGGLNKTTNDPIVPNAPRFKVFNSANDLPIDIIMSIEQDNAERLWISTEMGITMFNPKNETFINFNETDGLKKSLNSESTSFKDTNGEIYFGCSTGYYTFHPDSFAMRHTPPPIALINMQLFNKDVQIGNADAPLKYSISETQSLTLHAHQSVFSIEYAGLDYRNSDKLEYAFMLEGFEKEWNFVGKQRKATYTNLPAGKYTFKVKYTSTGTYDESAVRQLQIIILPPWYKTWWAYLIYTILFSIATFVARGIILQIIRLKNKVVIEQRLTDLKLRFFTNVSHELRTPLTLIMGPVNELIKDKHLTSRQYDYLRIVDNNARRMLRHINNLLDFRKVQTGKMRLQISETEIVSFLKQISYDFNELAASRNIQFTFTTNVEKLWAWIDTEKLDTVVFNLLSNAFKFTSDGKQIELQLNSLSGSDEFEIIVRDQGCGIENEDVPSLFERFAISRTATGIKTKGTGIGLSLVKEIVTLHKGKIDLKSVSGVGSTFSVLLHVGKKQFASTEVDIVDKTGQAPQHYYSITSDEVAGPSIIDTEMAEPIASDAPVVLIIEDNVDMRAFIKSKLSDYYRIIEAVDGTDGWKKATKHIPDLIVSDIMMPGYDGVELTRMLRDNFETSHIPIILLTAKSSVESMLEGMKFGADLYLTKPFNVDILLAGITNLLTQRQRLTEKFGKDKTLKLAPEEIIVTDKDEQFIKDVIHIVEENIINSDFNVEMIANALGLGRTTFFKKLKSLTGMAPVEFMRDMRVKRGHQLLSTGNYNVSEAAYQSGFSDAGYFGKCYKEKFGQSPAEFLKNVKS